MIRHPNRNSSRRPRGRWSICICDVGAISKGEKCSRCGRKHEIVADKKPSTMNLTTERGENLE